MLKEIDLTSLTVVHFEPVSIGELFAEVAVSSVRVAKFRSLLLAWEGGTVLSVELLHELTREDLDASAHRECVDRKDVLECDEQGHNYAPKELLRDLILICWDTGDLHLFQTIYYKQV